ncbi:MAG: hypothetical protein SGCHY_000425, partial [Lobulomycetales sp.]
MLQILFIVHLINKTLVNAQAPGDCQVLNNWIPSIVPLASCCSAQGVTCANGRVTELSFRRRGISGPIPDSIGQLTGLTRLDLYNNELSGPIPDYIRQLTGLTVLDLEYNQLSGSIPDSIGQLTGLTWLWLNRNQLSGPIPDSIGQLTGLTRLDLKILRSGSARYR